MRRIGPDAYPYVYYFGRTQPIFGWAFSAYKEILRMGQRDPNECLMLVLGPYPWLCD